MTKSVKQQESWRHFIHFLLSFKTEPALASLLDLFLTLEEKKDLLNRYAIVQALMFQDQSQRDIAQHLNVSIAKITRGSNFLKTLPPDVYLLIKNKIGSSYEKPKCRTISRKSQN